jgi:hypothetical protein
MSFQPSSNILSLPDIEFLISVTLQNVNKEHIHPRSLLGCQDSNLGVAAPKAAALPLGYTPIASGLLHKKTNSVKSWSKNISKKHL